MTKPNQLLMSVIEDGVGKSRIASMYLGSGSIVDSVTLNPARSEALLGKANFSGPHLIFLLK